MHAYKVATAMGAYTVVVGVIAVLGKVALDFAKLANILLHMHMPHKAIV